MKKSRFTDSQINASCTPKPRNLRFRGLFCRGCVASPRAGRHDRQMRA